MREEEKNNFHLEIAKQYFDLAKHAENVRFIYTNIYIPIILGFAVCLLKESSLHFYIQQILWLFMFLLSMLGFFISHLTRIDMLSFSRKAELILIKEYALHEDYRHYYQNNNDRSKNSWGSTLGSSSFCFHLFYISTSCLFLYIFLKNINPQWSVELVTFLFFIIFVLIYISLFQGKEKQLITGLQGKITS